MNFKKISVAHVINLSYSNRGSLVSTMSPLPTNFVTPVANLINKLHS